MAGILEVITKAGEDNVFVQPLMSCVTNIQSRKNGSSLVTFQTDKITPNDLMNAHSSKYVGVVVWIPREAI